jgi:hypothetical protein
LGRPAGRIDPAQEITFRFCDDQLFAITVVYEARLVDGLTNADIIEGVSAVYRAATLTAAAGRGPAPPPPGAINGSTAIASWQSTDYQFTLMREVYPATFRVIGVSSVERAGAPGARGEGRSGASRQTGRPAPRKRNRRGGRPIAGLRSKTRPARPTKANSDREEH